MSLRMADKMGHAVHDASSSKLGIVEAAGGERLDLLAVERPLVPKLEGLEALHEGKSGPGLCASRNHL